VVLTSTWTQIASYRLDTARFITPTGAGKFDINNEEGWTLLPNKQILTVDAYVFQYNATGTNSEAYVPASGKWHSAGSTIVQMSDSAADCGGQNYASYEVGPAVLRPDGTVFYTGANSCGAGHTAIYNSNSGTWAAGPDSRLAGHRRWSRCTSARRERAHRHKPRFRQRANLLFRVRWHQAETRSRAAQRSHGSCCKRYPSAPVTVTVQ